MRRRFASKHTFWEKRAEIFQQGMPKFAGKRENTPKMLSFFNQECLNSASKPISREDQARGAGTTLSIASAQIGSPRSSLSFYL